MIIHFNKGACLVVHNLKELVEVLPNDGAHVDVILVMLDLLSFLRYVNSSISRVVHNHNVHTFLNYICRVFHCSELMAINYYNYIFIWKDEIVVKQESIV
jgi:hypothetical protein